MPRTTNKSGFPAGLNKELYENYWKTEGYDYKPPAFFQRIQIMIEKIVDAIRYFL